LPAVRAHGSGRGAARHALHNTKRTLAASRDPKHLIATPSCGDLIIVHKPDATPVCRADLVKNIKELHNLVSQKHGDGIL